MPALRRKQELKKDPGQPRLCKRFKDSLDGEALKRNRTIQQDSDISIREEDGSHTTNPGGFLERNPSPAFCLMGVGGLALAWEEATFKSQAWWLISVILEKARQLFYVQNQPWVQRKTLPQETKHRRLGRRLSGQSTCCASLRG